MKSISHINAAKKGVNKKSSTAREGKRGLLSGEKPATCEAQQSSASKVLTFPQSHCPDKDFSNTRYPNTTAYTLHQMERKIARTPVIDSNRRNAIRTAVINGYYVANPGKIASKIIDMELNLFRKR